MFQKLKDKKKDLNDLTLNILLITYLFIVHEKLVIKQN